MEKRSDNIYISFNGINFDLRYLPRTDFEKLATMVDEERQERARIQAEGGSWSREEVERIAIAYQRQEKEAHDNWLRQERIKAAL